jgi:hypothetical protein
MIQIETEIMIGAPITRVWAILIDFANYSQWNPYLIRIDGEAYAGTTIIVHSVISPGTAPMIGPVQVISVEPYTMRWEGGLPDRGQFKGDHWFVLVQRGGMTHLHHFEYFSGSRSDAILSAHGDMIRANFTRFNEALAHYAQAQP